MLHDGIAQGADSPVTVDGLVPSSGFPSYRRYQIPISMGLESSEMEETALSARYRWSLCSARATSSEVLTSSPRARLTRDQADGLRFPTSTWLM